VDELALAIELLEELVFDASFLGQVLGVVDQGFGLLLSEPPEFAPADLEDLVDEAFESWPNADAKVAHEDDPFLSRRARRRSS
jgi:hypothetical protein